MKTKPFPKLLLPLLALACGVAPASAAAGDGGTPLRRIVSLDGAWQIAEGGMEQPPAAAFSRTVPVPGLADMARPAFDNPGPPVADRRQFPQKDPKRDAFWYRRVFTLDGSVPPAATLKIGKAMFGARVFLNGRQLGDHAPSFTPALLDARWLAADTEFWRSRRTAAGVLHFTMLGYDRPDGQTSDHWLDVASLKWEPEFYKHVRDAFAPIGVALDAWEETYPPGLTRDFPCVIINDTDAPHSGTLAIRLRRDGKVLAEETRAVVVKPFETGRETFELTLPKTHGPCEVEAVLLGTPSGDIHSVRDFIVHPLIPAAVPPLK